MNFALRNISTPLLQVSSTCAPSQVPLCPCLWCKCSFHLDPAPRRFSSLSSPGPPAPSSLVSDLGPALWVISPLSLYSLLGPCGLCFLISSLSELGRQLSFALGPKVNADDSHVWFCPPELHLRLQILFMMVIMLILTTFTLKSYVGCFRSQDLFPSSFGFESCT